MKNNLKSAQLFLAGADKLIIGEKLMIALNQTIGLAGQALLMAPAGLSLVDEAVSSLSSPQDCFIDASTTAHGLLPSLTAFGVDTKSLEEAIRTEPQFLRKTATDHAWADKRRQLAKALVGIPEGAFVQAAFETQSALQWQPAPLEAGARILLGHIPLPTLKPVPVSSIPFDAKVDSSRILPALVTREGAWRFFNDLASGIQFFTNVFGEGNRMNDGSDDQSISWAIAGHCVSIDIFRRRGVPFMETDDERELFEKLYETDSPPVLPPYSRIGCSYFPDKPLVSGVSARDIYVVYELDAADKLKVARINGVTSTGGDWTSSELVDGPFQIHSMRGKSILQLFTAGE